MTGDQVVEVEADYIPLTTGSVAEFYIEPMIPHINDIDVMCHWNNELAISAGHSPPTQLPAEFHSYVNVHEIVDCHFPGYVYLELLYLLTECVDDGEYQAVECERGWCLTTDDVDNIHGPAVLTLQGGSLLSHDEASRVAATSR